MLTSHEIFGFMSPALATEILGYIYESDRELYRATVAAVADARKLRPVFFERKSRADRDKEVIAMLSKQRLDLAAANLLRYWLLKKHNAMLGDFLDGLGIAHKDGVVDDLPATVTDAQLKTAVEGVLAKHPREAVAVYLNAFYSMNESSWPNLKTLLENDSRLQLG